MQSRVRSFFARYVLYATVVLICLVFTGAMWTALLMQQRNEREHIIENKRHENENLAKVFEAHVARTIRAAETTVADVAEQHRRSGIKLDIAQYAKDNSTDLDPYNSLGFVDEKGDLVLVSPALSTAVSVRNNDSYQYQAQHDTPGIYISQPRKGTLTAKWTVYLTRRVNKPDGSFGGYWSVGLDPSYFSKIYDDLDLGQHALVALVGRDGIVRARSAGGEDVIGGSLAGTRLFTKELPAADHGSYVSAVQLDQITRVFSYRTVRGYPLIVVVGTSQAAALTAYELNKTRYLVATGVATALVACLGLLAMLQIRRSARASEERQRSAGQAEALLQHERDFARGLIDAAPVIVLLLDTRGIIQHINPYFEQLCGYRLDEVKGKEWFATFLPARDQDRIRALFRTAVSGTPTRNFINPVVTRSGEEREIEWNDRTTRDSQGAITGLLAIGQDVTERHARERDIVRLASIARYSSDLVGVADLEGHALFLNEAGRQMVGIRDDARLRATTIPDFIAEADRRHRLPEIMSTVMEQGSWIGEFSLRHLQTGAEIPVQSNIFRIDDPVGGGPLSLATVCRDLSERKTAELALRLNEARLNEAQRIAQVGSWNLDLVGGRLEWSDEIFRIFEIDSAHFAASYEAFLDAIHPDDREAVNAAYTKSLADRAPYQIEHRLCMADGRIKWVQERCTSEFDADGKPLRSLGTVQDITERHLLEQRLAKMNEQLEQQVAERTAELATALESARESNRAKTAFLSGMSHELRTPMNAILGFSQLLQMQSLPPQQLDAVDEIRRAGQHLLALIDDLLDLTRIEAGKLAVVAVPVDVAGVMDEALRIVQPMFSVRGLDLVNRTSTGTRVLADPVRLRQVLVNLLSNAAKYNREGGRVVIDATSPAPQRLRLRVSDTGAGIAPERMSRLFQTFERLGAEHSGVEGSGIGLALSRQLAELMGGTLDVDSRVGEGSTFWIELPTATGAVTADAAAGGSAHSVATATPFHVLYVEDNQANLKVVELMFKTRPHWCLRTATTGPEGLDRARSALPDAILLDIQLPGMDGYAVLQALRADPLLHAVPVVALSADAMPAQVKRGLRAGFRDYLPKPLDLQRLMFVLAELAALPRR